MDYIIQIISVIGSLASIIALPIAIIQILKVKEKIDDANAITNKFINYINNEKLETVFKGLEIQHNNILSIKTSYKKPGTRLNDIQNSVENTIRMINEYCHKIPSEHNEIESLLHDVIISLTSFVELSDNNKETTVEILGKGNKCRRVKISSYAAKVLKGYIEKRHIERSPNRHIFSSQTHEQMTISCIEEIVKKYVSKAKELHPDKFLMNNYTPHSIRHTTATHMLEAGVPLMVIRNFLGHASIQTTQIYADLSQNTVDENIRKWNEKWFPPTIQPEVPKCEDNPMPDFLRP